MKLALSLSGLASGHIFFLALTHWYVLIVMGPGTDTDALFASMAMPQFILLITSGSLMHVLVPLLAGKEEEDLRGDAWGLVLIVAGLFAAIAALLYAFAPFWISLLFPGFSESGKSLAIDLTRIQLMGMVFTAVSGVLWSVYHSRQRFIWAELSPMLAAMTSFGLLVVTLPWYGIVAAAWLGVLRTGFQTVLMLPVLGTYRRPEWNSQVLRDAWRRLRPLLIGTSYYKTDALVDRLLSSMASAGGLSLFYLGQQVYGVVNQILNKGVAAPMVPVLAKCAKTGQWTMFRRGYRRRVLWMAGVTGAGYLVFLLTGRPLLTLLIGYGSVTLQNVVLLWLIMVALVGVLVGGVTGQILSAAFYAKGNTVIPTKIGVVGFTLGIVLKVIGFLKLGLVGLALGTTVYYLLNAVLLLVFLEKELNDALSA